jgi:hypothetical protein
MSDYNYYKVGGSLEYQHPTYVVRQADFEFYEGLRKVNFSSWWRDREALPPYSA